MYNLSNPTNSESGVSLDQILNDQRNSMFNQMPYLVRSGRTNAPFLPSLAGPYQNQAAFPQYRPSSELRSQEYRSLMLREIELRVIEQNHTVYTGHVNNNFRNHHNLNANRSAADTNLINERSYNAGHFQPAPMPQFAPGRFPPDSNYQNKLSHLDSATSNTQRVQTDEPPGKPCEARATQTVDFRFTSSNSTQTCQPCFRQFESLNLFKRPSDKGTQTDDLGNYKTNYILVPVYPSQYSNPASLAQIQAQNQASITANRLNLPHLNGVFEKGIQPDQPPAESQGPSKIKTECPVGPVKPLSHQQTFQPLKIQTDQLPSVTPVSRERLQELMQERLQELIQANSNAEQQAELVLSDIKEEPVERPSSDTQENVVTRKCAAQCKDDCRCSKCSHLRNSTEPSASEFPPILLNIKQEDQQIVDSSNQLPPTENEPIPSTVVPAAVRSRDSRTSQTSSSAPHPDQSNTSSLADPVSRSPTEDRQTRLEGHDHTLMDIPGIPILSPSELTPFDWDAEESVTYDVEMTRRPVNQTTSTQAKGYMSFLDNTLTYHPLGKAKSAPSRPRTGSSRIAGKRRIKKKRCSCCDWTRPSAKRGRRGVRVIEHSQPVDRCVL